MSNLEKKVREEIQKTGLPMEIKATKLLKDNGWSVYNEYPYLDDEKNKMRQLDIKATKDFPSKACTLYIECKKSSKRSWVFYTEKMPRSYLSLIFGRLADDFLVGSIAYIDKSMGHKTPIDILSKIPPSFHKRQYRIALSHKIVFGDKDEFYTAQMQILKALHYEKIYPADHKMKEVVIIPVILFDGNIFECYYKNDKLCTPKTDYTRYLSQGLPNQKIPALIDVMTLEHFPKYLSFLGEELHLSDSN